MKLCVSFFIAYSCIQGVLTQSEIEVSKILDELLVGYDGRFRPNSQGDPVFVNVSLYIEELSGFRESSGDYEVTLYVREVWNDPRLVNSKLDKAVLLNEAIMKHVWMPDTDVANQKKFEILSFADEGKIMYLYPNGNVRLILKANAVLLCQYNLLNYPMDRQICKIKLQTFATSVDDIQLNWAKHHPVEISSPTYSQKFWIEDIDTVEYFKSFSTGEFSFIEVHFYLRRYASHCLLKYFFPTALIVCTSWISFWMDCKSETSRAILGISTILGMVYFAASSETQVAYLTALDKWNIVCTIFVFLAFVEFSLVHFLHRRYSRNKQQQSKKSESSDFEEIPRSTPKKKMDLASKIDFVSRIAFPFSFFIYTILYVIS